MEMWFWEGAITWLREGVVKGRSCHMVEGGVITWLREGVVENGDLSWGENHMAM